jgi:hypothetical protein
METHSAVIPFSMVETAEGVLVKTISLNQKGERVTEHGGHMVKGECWAGHATGMRDVASRFVQCTSKQAVMLGVPRDGFGATSGAC